MRNATSSDGEYLPASMALTVWRVTPTFSARSWCVISPCSKRSRRMELVTVVGATSGPAPVVHDARHMLHDLREHERHEHGHAHCDGACTGQMQRHEDAEERAQGKGVIGDADGLQVDELFALV